MAKKKLSAKENNTANKKTSNPTLSISNGQVNGLRKQTHLSIQKTYKLYIGGKFPRTESGRYYKLMNTENKLIANICQGSRKDFRNAVVAARKAFGAWSGKTAYNRGQILYRVAEMLEGRKAQFVSELLELGATKKKAETEVDLAIDRMVYYAGWADKYQQIFSAVNPVASSHFNFTVLEPTGVVAAFAPEAFGLLGLVSIIAPIIVGGNTCVVLASETQATLAISFAEVIHSSDVPGGVINILTGSRKELITHFSSHKDVNAMIYCGENQEQIKRIKKAATDNLKRVRIYNKVWSNQQEGQNPYFILDTQESKTTWHPIQIQFTGGGSY